VADSLKYKTPKGKVVYGGGGIIPDVFVPIADDGLLGVEQLEAYGLVDYFVFEQMDQTRGYWLGLNEQNWGQKPSIPEGWVDAFEDYLKNQGMEWNWGAPEREALELALKASAAGQRFGETAALKIRGGADPMIALILAHKPTSWADFAIFAPK
jgi:carboxyl-terminal processing protease